MFTVKGIHHDGTTWLVYTWLQGPRILGWLTAILAALMQVAKIATVLSASPRNVLEASFLLFVICMASGVRAIALRQSAA